MHEQADKMKMMTTVHVANFIVCLFSVTMALKDEWDTVDQLSYNLKVHDTRLFQHRSGIHVRHGLEIHLVVQLLDDHCTCDEPFKFG